MSPQIEIAYIVQAQADAVRRGDSAAMLANVSDDVVVYDVVEPLRRIGLDAVRERAAEWLASYAGPIEWDNRDVVVTADENVAFCSMLSHVAGRLKNGQAIDMWFRKTLGLQRRSGRWLITHDHGSVPFDPVNGRASLQLNP